MPTDVFIDNFSIRSDHFLFPFRSQKKMFSDIGDDDLLLGLPSPILTKTMVNINNSGKYIKLFRKWTHGIE